MTIISCMVPNKLSPSDTMFCHLGSLFTHSYPTNNLQNQNFEKMKKRPGHIILHMSTKNDNILCTINHMMYGSCGMECKWQIFLSFQTDFCPFTLLTNQKIKILTKKSKKTPRDIIILYMCSTNNNHPSQKNNWCLASISQF